MIASTHLTTCTEFKEEVIQDVLSLPPNLIVKRVHCNSIRVKVSVDYNRCRDTFVPTHSMLLSSLDSMETTATQPHCILSGSNSCGLGRASSFTEAQEKVPHHVCFLFFFLRKLGCTNLRCNRKEQEASKRGFAAKLIEGLQLEINELQLSIQTLGKDKSGVIGPSSPPLLKLQVKNILVQSTNSKWEARVSPN